MIFSFKSFHFCRHFSELFRYHKYETDSVDLKAFTDVIKRMKQLEVLFPGQGANDTSLDATSIGSDGSSSRPSDTFEEIDSVWVSIEYTLVQMIHGIINEQGVHSILL